MKNFEKIILYSYINSGNHGCEAIARSTYSILNMEENENIIFTSDVEEDTRMELDKKWSLRAVTQLNGIFPLNSIFPRALRKLGIDKDALWKYQYKELKKLFNSNTLAISTGGDIYCYAGSDWLTYLNKEAKKRGAKTVLWGCSIEEKYMDERVVEDLKKYDLITVRESYTKKALEKKGIIDNVKLYPDPAFVLEREKIDIFDWNKMGKCIGLNLSKYVVKNEQILELFCEFIKYITDNTEYSVVLIPHVFWSHENDLELANTIYNRVHNDKVYIVDKEYKCTQLKYIISRCTIFMGARTHSVIAAYSSNVPALGFSYSMKSRGIANDIFGEEDNYVMSISGKTNLEDLIKKLTFFDNNYSSIVNKLKVKIVEYEKALNEEIKVIEALY